MTTCALNEAYQSVEDITDKFDVPSKKKTTTVLQSVLNAFSEEESVALAHDLLRIVKQLKAMFTTEDLDLLQAITNLEKSNDGLTKLNSILDFIKFMFDGEDENKIQIDGYEFINCMAALQKSQKELQYISDYLTLVVKTKKGATSEEKEYTIDEISEFLTAA